MKKKELKWHNAKDFDYPKENGDYLCYHNDEYFIAWFNKRTLEFLENYSRIDKILKVDYWIDLSDFPSFNETY